MSREVSSRDWFGKTSAGLILGFLLALGLSGIYKLLLGLGDTYFSTQGQVGMWLMAPIWAGVLSFCFLFASTRRAWTWLGLATGLVWAILFVAGGLA